MLRVERLKAEDLVALGRPLSAGKKLEAEEYSLSVFAGEKLLMCAGVALYWEGRGEAWAVLSPDARTHAVAISKGVKKFIKGCPIRRIEAAAEFGRQDEFRWIELLGFEFENFAEGFLPNGNAAHVFSRVRRSDG